MTLEIYPAWPKIPRLSKTIIVTEKIDGTNGLISIERKPFGSSIEFETLPDPTVLTVVMGEIPEGEELPSDEFYVRAGSRNRWLSLTSDNFDFARWVYSNATELALGLGEGSHYGEYYGRGIGRNYGMDHRRFALFNTGRWSEQNTPSCVNVVPTLAIEGDGALITASVVESVWALEDGGSQAMGARGFRRPEGVVIYHTASRQYYKYLIEGNDRPKSAAVNLQALADAA